jgi:hypothetical protein
LLKNRQVYIQDFNQIKRVERYNEEVSSVLSVFNFDWFSEDPGQFTGD